MRGDDLAVALHCAQSVRDLCSLNSLINVPSFSKVFFPAVSQETHISVYLVSITASSLRLLSYKPSVVFFFQVC